MVPNESIRTECAQSIKGLVSLRPSSLGFSGATVQAEGDNCYEIWISRKSLLYAPLDINSSPNVRMVVDLGKGAVLRPSGPTCQQRRTKRLLRRIVVGLTQAF
uniref:Uncharacterized protein n=1 Tax=Steinernema glaseri TaxID=37863 RepID=A0A1I7ZZW6_9BILA